MIITNIQNVIPDRDSVIVRLLKLDEVYQEVITQSASSEQEVAIRVGKVISMGPDVSLPEHCSLLQVDDNAIFTEFAGYYIATNDGELYKCIRGYDIIGITSNVYDMNNFTVTPTADRIFVEVIDQTVSEDGVVLGANAKDPRLADLTFGKIVGIGAGVKSTWTVGSIIAFPAYVGTEIRPFVSQEQPELRMIVEGDSQFHILIQ